MLKIMELQDHYFRLAVYGSLAPGMSNHHHLSEMRGEWSEGWIEGVLHDRGWGAGMGFPGIVLEMGGPRAKVHLFESPDLPEHWRRLDEFEGEQYQRCPVLVHFDKGLPSLAFTYALKEESPSIRAD
ncbi:MAG: gamma-glutamylcyclotransferase [Planctomycetota bacterium]|nr:gamma-glutamylcyclotransferase [Planctomycetota bacterium]